MSRLSRLWEVGIVSYKDLPAPEIEAPDVVYRVDTDVITSITLNSRAPDSEQSRKGNLLHQTGPTVLPIFVMPSYSSQVVWVKWHTPSTPQDIRIRVSVSSGNTSETEFIARIESLDENPPPDPQATDTNPRFYHAFPAEGYAEDVRFLECLVRLLGVGFL
mgnify:CR=1 FL=1